MTISEAVAQTPFLLGQILDWPARIYPNRAAIEWDEGSLTFKQLAAKVTACEATFARLGAARFQRWGLALGNSPDFLIALFALWRLGCVVAPLRPIQTAARFREAVAGADLHALVVKKDCLALDELTCTASQSVDVDEARILFVGMNSNGHGFRAGGRSIDVDPALILWSSGSIARARGIVLQHHAVLANIWSNIRALGYRDDDRTLIVLPLYHAYALVHQCLSHLAIGATVCIPPTPLAPALLSSALNRFSITTLATAPPVLHLLVEGLRRGRSCPDLRLVTVGAARANPQSVVRFQELLPDVRLAITYGLTEACPRVSTHFVGAETFDPTCVGTLHENVEMLRSATDAGEIILRGRSMMRNYADEAFEEGSDHVLRTNDVGDIIEGRLRLLGRGGRVINRGGMLIRPETIEDALLAHPAVSAAHVEGAPHAFWGEVPVATVVPRSDAPQALVEELNRCCVERLLSEEVPARIVISSDLNRPSKSQQMLAMFVEEMPV